MRIFEVPERGSDYDIAAQPAGEVDPLLQQFKNVTPSSLAEKKKARALEQRCERLIDWRSR